MFKTYFKQSIEMLKQNKFISMIAILGTALAIMMIMAIVVTDNVKNISVAPEINRDRTYYLPYEIVREYQAGKQQGAIAADAGRAQSTISEGIARIRELVGEAT